LPGFYNYGHYDPTPEFVQTNFRHILDFPFNFIDLWAMQHEKTQSNQGHHPVLQGRKGAFFKERKTCRTVCLFPNKNNNDRSL